MSLSFSHRRSATASEIEYTAACLYRAEVEIRNMLHGALYADSFDRANKLAESLRAARLDLERDMMRRDDTDGRWQLTEQHMIQRGVIKGDQE